MYPVVEDVDSGEAGVGQGIHGNKLSAFATQFCYEQNTTLKKVY